MIIYNWGCLTQESSVWNTKDWWNKLEVTESATANLILLYNMPLPPNEISWFVTGLHNQCKIKTKPFWLTASRMLSLTSFLGFNLSSYLLCTHKRSSCSLFIKLCEILRKYQVSHKNVLLQLYWTRKRSNKQVMQNTQEQKCAGEFKLF